MSHKVIYKCLRGSHAQGVSTPTSDRDFFEIVIPPVEAILGLQEQRGGQSIENGEDVRTVTLKEFLRQCLHGRSTELECLFAKPEHITENTVYGKILLANRSKLVSQRLYPSLMGFYKAQKYRMFRGNAGRIDSALGFDPKMGAHCIRAIWQLINLKKTGNLDIYIGDPVAHNDIMNLKSGRVGLADLTKLCEWYEDKLKDLKDDLVLPNPDYTWANNFLMEAYYEHCQTSSNLNCPNADELWDYTDPNRHRLSKR